MSLSRAIRRDLALLEAQNYEAMFGDVTNDPKSKAYVRDLIASAKTYLDKKNDRMVWYLRWMKLALLFKASEKSEEAMNAYRAAVVEYARKSGLGMDPVGAAAKDLATGYYGVSGQRLLIDIEHFLSLPIAGIRSFVFRYETPDEVLRTFGKMEDKWKEMLKGAFEDPDAKVILDFHNGWVWVDTGKPSCSKEAKAMGHCGNEPRSYSNDRLLSLRKTIKAGEKVFYEPHLTFILHENGMLGEMKGKGNDKPDPRYHDMIVALLKLSIIKGIKGGGYMPENNFSVQDLEEDQRDELLDEKPELGGIYHMYSKYGFKGPVPGLVKDMLYDGPANRDPPMFEVVGNTIKLQEWPDLESFLGDVEPFGIPMRLLKIVLGESDETENLEVDLSQETVYDILQRLNDRELKTLTDYVGLPAINMRKNARPQLLQLANEVRRTRLIDSLEEVMTEMASQTEKLKETALEKLKEYLDVYFSFHGMAQYVKIDKDDIKAPVSLFISIEDLIDMLDDSDAENYSIYDIDEYGWYEIEEEHLYYQRKEEGLKTDEKTKLKDLGLTVVEDFDWVAVGDLWMKRAFA